MNKKWLMIGGLVVLALIVSGIVLYQRLMARTEQYTRIVTSPTGGG